MYLINEKNKAFAQSIDIINEAMNSEEFKDDLERSTFFRVGKNLIDDVIVSISSFHTSCLVISEASNVDALIKDYAEKAEQIFSLRKELSIKDVILGVGNNDSKENTSLYSKDEKILELKKLLGKNSSYLLPLLINKNDNETFRRIYASFKGNDERKNKLLKLIIDTFSKYSPQEKFYTREEIALAKTVLISERIKIDVSSNDFEEKLDFDSEKVPKSIFGLIISNIVIFSTFVAAVILLIKTFTNFIVNYFNYLGFILRKIAGYILKIFIEIIKTISNLNEFFI